MLQKCIIIEMYACGNTRNLAILCILKNWTGTFIPTDLLVYKRVSIGGRVWRKIKHFVKFTILMSGPNMIIESYTLFCQRNFVIWNISRKMMYFAVFCMFTRITASTCLPCFCFWKLSKAFWKFSSHSISDTNTTLLKN